MEIIDVMDTIIEEIVFSVEPEVLEFVEIIIEEDES